MCGTLHACEYGASRTAEVSPFVWFHFIVSHTHRNRAAGQFLAAFST